MSKSDIAKLEAEIYAKNLELTRLRGEVAGEEVADYTFETQEGEVRLSELFADKSQLLLIHNMGQGCRYCTLWGDGISAFLPHLESEIAVAMVSKDDPATQRRFANSRGWRFRMASHANSNYLQEQYCGPEPGNYPGAISYELRDGKILRKNTCEFGPGDLYCSFWHLLGLFGLGANDWTAQYNYWQRPSKLDDGGDNVLG